MKSWTIFLSIFTFAFVVVAARYAWGFVLSYRRENWREYDAGRHLMEFTFGMAVILTYTILAIPVRYFFNHTWLLVFFDVSRLVIFMWIAKVLHDRHTLLIENKRDGVSSQDNMTDIERENQT